MPLDLDPIWRALANPLRREILDLLRDGPVSTSDLVLAFPAVSRFAVMQHIGVLEEAGLLVAQKVGRTRLNFLNVVPIRQIYDRWVRQYEEGWADGLIDLKQRLEGQSSPRRLKPTPSPSSDRLEEIPRSRRSERRLKPTGRKPKDTSHHG